MITLYKIDLPSDYHVSATFDVSHLSPYEDDDKVDNLWSNFAKSGEDDKESLWSCQNKKN